MSERERVEALANDHARSLRADDFSADRVVLIRHADGTQFLFRHAFLAHHADWRLVFTEHNGVHCFHADVLVEAEEFLRDSRVVAL